MATLASGFATPALRQASALTQSRGEQNSSQQPSKNNHQIVFNLEDEINIKSFVNQIPTSLIKTGRCLFNGGRMAHVMDGWHGRQHYYLTLKNILLVTYIIFQKRLRPIRLWLVFTERPQPPALKSPIEQRTS